jgi:CO dehydrogenase maturation factor
MRIAFVGKGGSGKTTLSSLFIRHLASRGAPVLAIDADINQHLAAALGTDGGAAPALAEDMRLIKEYLRGSNPRIRSADDMVKTTPPGKGSRLLSLKARNPIFSTFGRAAQGALLLSTGGFCEEDIGVKCYHSKTGAVELILNHLVDGPGEYVVVDMTAGADSFASGLFTKFDLTAIVVEPTAKSVSVYEQYRGYARDYGIALAAVANKIESSDDADYVRSLVGDALVATIGRSGFIRAGERGERRPFTELEPDALAALERLREELDARSKDWTAFYRQAVEFHGKNADSWASASVGRDLREQIDPEFAYPA